MTCSQRPGALSLPPEIMEMARKALERQEAARAPIYLDHAGLPCTKQFIERVYRPIGFEE